MKRFKSILVGVNFAEGDQLVAGNLPAATNEAILRANWLAEINSAQLTFCTVLPLAAHNLDAKTQMFLEEGHDRRSVQDHANELIAEIAARANAKGLKANGVVLNGAGWIELIRLTIRKNHDLLVAGYQRRKFARWLMVGSTTTKLLRKCPCPVWVTKPQSESKIESILVAHDLGSVGDLAMDLGCSMAKLHGAQLHVIHREEFSEFNSALPAIVSTAKLAEYRLEGKRHIASQLKGHGMSAIVHFVTGPAAPAILNYIDQNSIELLVMGTVARIGIPGLITGNTAERILPHIPCSILAVKPSGFKSPVTLYDDLQ